MKLDIKDRTLSMSKVRCDFCDREGISCYSSHDFGYPHLPNPTIVVPLPVYGWSAGSSTHTYIGEAHDGHAEPELKLEVLDAGGGNYIQIESKGLAFDSHREVDAFANFLKNFLPTPIKHDITQS
jgi:hypothetical protein